MLIGLHGRKGTGKSTAARYLCEQYGFIEFSFAKSLKRACIELFGTTEEQMFGAEKELEDPFWKCTPREMMQMVGTAVRSLPIRNIFIRNVQKQIASHPNSRIVVSDIRYDDEAKALLEMGACIWKIERTTSFIDHHESEQQRVDCIEETIPNNKTLKQFYEQIDLIIAYKEKRCHPE